VTAPAFRVVVTGSRQWPDPATVHAELDRQLAEHPFLVVVHGDCPRGADRQARDWCREHAETAEERHPADWHRHGRAAGTIRNQQMIDSGADLVLGFPTAASRGTLHCLTAARRAGIPVRVVPVPEARQCDGQPAESAVTR
jgi:hypothetical protein